MSQPITRASFGILAPLGAIVLLVWAVGFVLFGMHAGYWHLLVPAGILLVLIQGIIRITGGADGPV